MALRDKNHVRASVTALALVAALAGCSKQPEGNGSTSAASSGYFGDVSPPHDQTFTFNNGAEPEHLDPAVMSGQPDGRIARMVFEGLVSSDPHTLAPVPGAARGWDVSADGLTYTFHLRPGLVWADGHPLTAQDFLWSWQRVLAPRTGGSYATFLYPVKNAEAYNKGEFADSTRLGLSAPDDTTFIVTLENPTPYFLELAAYYTCLPTPRHVIEKLGPNWEHALRIVGNGPFRIADWKQKDRYVLVPNDRYWDRANVRLRKIIALAVEENATSTNLYKAGVIDWNPSGYVPKQVIPFIHHYKDYEDGPQDALYFYSISTLQKPFDDVRVRQALSLATDRETIARYVLKGVVPAWGNMTPSGYVGYQAPPPVPYDPERARKLLAEAGYPGGKGFPSFEILFNTSEDHRRIAEAIQAMWKRELGIPVKLANQEWASYLSAVKAKQYSVARRSWIGDYRDPLTFLDMWKSGDGNNRTGWSNARYDALIRDSKREVDPAKRLSMLSEAEGILLTQGPVIPIYHYTQSGLLKPYVQGIYVTPLDFHPLTRVSIDTHWRRDAATVAEAPAEDRP